MRPISKRPEPVAFTNWKASGNADWSPTYADLRQPLKPIVLHALQTEQGWLCCYCERRIAPDSNDDSSHIEHLRAQENTDDAAAIDFQNMLASCNGVRRPAHGGGQ